MYLYLNEDIKMFAFNSTTLMNKIKIVFDAIKYFFGEDAFDT